MLLNKFTDEILIKRNNNYDLLNRLVFFYEALAKDVAEEICVRATKHNLANKRVKLMLRKRIDELNEQGHDYCSYGIVI